MKNIIVTVLAFALVGCGGPSAEDAGIVQEEVVSEEAPAVEAVVEEAPVETVVE